MICSLPDAPPAGTDTMTHPDSPPHRVCWSSDVGLDDIPALRVAVGDAARALGADEDAAWRLELAADELVTNVVTHGRTGGRVGVDVRVERGSDTSGASLRLVVVDDGPAFDPTAVAPAAVDAPLEEREAGGLGLHLVAGVADEIVHERDGRNNVTSVMVRITPDPDPR